MLPNSKLLNVLVVLGIAICLFQAWLPAHYITCDGPCHLYNARIVNDIWKGNNTAVYGRFYELVYTTDPNSFSTFALAALLYLFNGAVAEKVYLSAYILVYVVGFIALLRKLSGGSSYWLLSVFVFVFTYALAKGFYNLSFGIAFYFWMVWSWLRFLDNPRPAIALLFFLCAALAFFTHLLPFVFGAITCFCLVLSYGFSRYNSSTQKSVAAYIVRSSIFLVLLLSPFVAMTVWFTTKEGGLRLQLSPHLYRLIELVEFKYIINLVPAERLWAAVAGICLTILFVVVALKNVRGFKLHRYDGFLFCLLPIAFIYIFFPEDFMGRAIIISIRTQLFIFILVVCVLAYRQPGRQLANAGALILFACFGMLTLYRVNCRRVADSALAELLSATNHISPGAVVLPLDFCPNGKDKSGNLIAVRNAVFHHAAQYMGVDKTLIILDNYEANMGYFPLRWKKEKNPYIHLSTGAGIEGLPPNARIAAYEQQTGAVVDNVLLWCYDPAYLSDPGFAELYSHISLNYHQVFASPGSRVLLYARNRP